MGKPYTADLRLVVVRLIEEGHTRPEVAELCGISLSSIGRFIRRYRTSGSVSPDKFGGYKGYALANYAGRIKRWIAKAASSVFRFLRHLGLTYKKALHAAEQDRPDVATLRRRWRRSQRKLDPRRLVFIDETAISTSMTRRGGRAARGQRLVCKVPFGAWQSMTMVAALRHDRMTAPMTLNGAMTGESFRSYISRRCSGRHCGETILL